MSESDPLLSQNTLNANSGGLNSHEGNNDSIVTSSQRWLLPLSFITAFACTATSATSIFAFAKLICRGETGCTRDDSIRFTKTVAIATSCANIFGALTLFPLERLARKGARPGLLIWLLIRCLSPICLLIGVLRGSFVIALLSKLFESVASDNVFHFHLNAAYSQATSQLLRDRLMAASLGLFMIGVSVSPFVGGVLHNFTISFVLSIALFSLSIIHVMMTGNNMVSSNELGSVKVYSASSSKLCSIITGSRHIIIEVVRPIAKSRRSILIGLSLFVYNSGQCYAFESLLVSNTILFGFGPRENGIIISSAHVASALMLAGITLFQRKSWRVESSDIAPKRQGDDDSERKRSSQRLTCATCSLGIYGIALICLGFAANKAQIYGASIFIATGLAASFFLKAELISTMPPSDGPAAAAFAAATEIAASLLAPLVIGQIQALWNPQRTLAILGFMMFVAAGLLVFTRR